MQARDTGRSDEAERHFASSVKRYGEAAAIGQSDSEVYEALADSWIGQIEMTQNRARPIDSLMRRRSPMPLFTKAADLLLPAVQRNPRFLWGLDSLSNVYGMQGIYLQQKGSAAAAAALAKAIKSSEAAAALDESDLSAPTNVILGLSLLIKEVSTDAVREAHLAQGLSAIERLLAISPSHALGLATQGALYLVRAQAERTPALRQAAARSAVERLQAALVRSPFLSASYLPLLQSARALVSP